MSTVLELPSKRPSPMAEVLDRLCGAPRLKPFSAPATAVLGELSRRILAEPDLARRPETAALAFWLRPANLAVLAKDVPPAPRNAMRVPAGLALHFAPANVDSMFVYSWAFSLLAGNRNLLRLSSRRGEMAERLLGLIPKALEMAPEVAQGTAFIQFDHDDAITAAASARCDLRIIWGGNASVAAVRAVPLSPHANEIVFADRLSLTLLSAQAVLALSDTELTALAGRMFNDIYSFDQMACSSARLLVWLGGTTEADDAEQRLSTAMRAQCSQRRYALEPATALAKYSLACRASMDLPVRKVEAAAMDWVVIDLGKGMPDTARMEVCGGGLLYGCRVDSLDEIVPGVGRNMQTLSHFGIALEQLEALASELAGRGIDRMVPVGEALAFGPIWDGYNLLAQMGRLVVVR
ncbi:MAG: hypothetical protein H7Y60_05240 [Rhodospirillaceae bacterium]|nr:hypothetical protein [Rhodospirillales bacterium]